MLLSILLDGFPGVPDFLTLPPYNDVNSSLIVTNLTCDYYGCENTFVPSDNGCNDYGNNAIVTCAIGNIIIVL